jgi:alcohol dehydrogenase
MTQIRKFVAPEFIFGVSAIDQTIRYVRNLGAAKPLVVSDAGVVAAGWTQKIMEMLNENDIEYASYNQISPNPRDFEVMAGAQVYLQEKCDMIIAIGGGSVMDTAKALGIVFTNQADVTTFAGVDNVGIPGPPLICIPTTAGTSADVSQFAIINNTAERVKFAIISTAMVPDVALIDPQLSLTMDSYLSACTGMDALVHAMEAFTSTASSYMTDIHALEAIRILRQNLPLMMKTPDDIHVRTLMMQGSLQAGLAFSNASLGAVHSLAHCLGGYLDLPHGECNAILLDHVVEYNYPKASQRYDEIARVMGLDIQGKTESEKAKLLISDIQNLKAQLGIKDTLSQKGLSRSDIALLAKNALNDPCLITNPRTAKQRDLEVIYEEAL